MATTDKMQYPREGRKQVSEKFTRWIAENSMSAEPSFPVGEYLGDLEVTDRMLASLTNINPTVNSIDQVKRGRYIVYGDFDYAGDGKFLGFRLEPLREQEAAEREPADGSEPAGMVGVFTQGGLL